MAKKPSTPKPSTLTRAQRHAYNDARKHDAEASALRHGDHDAILRAARKRAAAAVKKIADEAPAGQRKTIGFAKRGLRAR